MKRYLIRFAQIKEDFRLPELESLKEILKVSCSFEPNTYKRECPFMIAEFPDDEHVKRLLKRAVLIKEVIELLGEAETLEKLHQEAKKIPLTYFEPYENLSFKFTVDSYGHVYQTDQQVALINTFSYLPLKGPVSIDAAQVIFSLMINSDPTKLNSAPLRFYWGRSVGVGQRDLGDRFSLKRRIYLGTTSMEAELAFLMANLAGVMPGMLVYDPFVGTGSCLIPAAYFGALTLGSDIDGRQMRGDLASPNASNSSMEQSKKSIHSNELQYGLSTRTLGTIVCDIKQHPWREGMFFDAILTDPPYGCRAGARKIGRRPLAKPDHISRQLHLLSPQERASRYPQTIHYESEEMQLDLFAFGQRFLRPQGRLVFWFALEKAEDGTEPTPILPEHPAYERLAAIPQVCREFTRWLMVFRLKLQQ